MDRQDHYDLMLEHNGELLTWALDREPSSESPASAKMLAPHRLAYLEYEGPISGDRGHVTRWDWGTFSWVINTTEKKKVLLVGSRIQGRCVIQATENTPGTGWRISFAG